MNNIKNQEVDKWIRPWEETKFDDLYNRDERFFSILLKGALSWLNRNIVLYNKSIKHFIFNTGSAYMYVESNGYEFNWSETSGEDGIYMEMPRCIVELGQINIPMEELSNPFSRGYYERRSGNNINGYNAEIRRIPIEMSITLKYVLSNFNESIVLLQELFDKILFQRYFNINYLGQIIQCSIEFPNSAQTEINKIDFSSAETNQKNINLELKICSNYPQINTHSEILGSKIISEFDIRTNVIKSDNNENQFLTDIDNKKIY